MRYFESTARTCKKKIRIRPEKHQFQSPDPKWTCKQNQTGKSIAVELVPSFTNTLDWDEKQLNCLTYNKNKQASTLGCSRLLKSTKGMEKKNENNHTGWRINIVSAYIAKNIFLC